MYTACMRVFVSASNYLQQPDLFNLSVLLKGEAFLSQGERAPVQAQHLHPEQSLGRVRCRTRVHGGRECVCRSSWFMHVEVTCGSSHAVYGVSGAEAAHGPLHELSGGGTEGCGPSSGAQSHILCVREGSAELSHAAGAGYARGR